MADAPMLSTPKTSMLGVIDKIGMTRQLVECVVMMGESLDDDGQRDAFIRIARVIDEFLEGAVDDIRSRLNGGAA